MTGRGKSRTRTSTKVSSRSPKVRSKQVAAPPRKYTIYEIDEMRQYLLILFSYEHPKAVYYGWENTWFNPGYELEMMEVQGYGSLRSSLDWRQDASADSADVEERLRTALIGGVTVAGLRSKVEQEAIKVRERIERREKEENARKLQEEVKTQESFGITIASEPPTVESMNPTHSDSSLHGGTLKDCDVGPSARFTWKYWFK